MVPCLTFPNDSLILHVKKSRGSQKGDKGSSLKIHTAPSKVVQLGSPCLSPLQNDRSLPQQMWAVEIPGQISACHAERREREQRSTGRVLSCFVLAFPPLCGLQTVLISLRSVSLGCWAGWDYLGAGNFLAGPDAGLWNPNSLCLAPGSEGWYSLLYPGQQGYWSGDIRTSQQAHQYPGPGRHCLFLNNRSLVYALT